MVTETDKKIDKKSLLESASLRGRLKIKRLYVILGMLDRSSPPVELFLFGINEGDSVNIGLGRGYVSYKKVGSKSTFF